VKNQFGEFQFDTIMPNRVSLPTATSLTGPVAEPNLELDPTDAYKCYTVKISAKTTKLPKNLQEELVDQFDQATLYNVVKPTRLCQPVSVGGSTITYPTAAVMCYQIKVAKGELKHIPVKGVFLRNHQFEPERVDTIKEDELCVVSTIED
jgi:hypothetical protein